MPSTVKEAFGIYPVDRPALDRSQLFQPMFPTVKHAPNIQQLDTWITCGQFVKSPASMTKILLPQTSKPKKQNAQKKKIITERRIISSENMLQKLTVIL